MAAAAVIARTDSRLNELMGESLSSKGVVNARVRRSSLPPARAVCQRNDSIVMRGFSLVRVTPSEQEPRWLDEGEMRAWRTYVNGSSMLMDRLHRELQDTHGVSLADYEILVRLSEQPNHRMRMTQLAEDVASSKSRVSHQVARMEKAGLVLRRECTEDGRGVLAELTPKGMAQLVEAAPTHLRGVRAHIVDLLSPEEGEVLAKVFDRVMTHLRESNG
ncbi:hypothetical protein GCM10027200_30670 [Lentzea nigeriaca]